MKLAFASSTLRGLRIALYLRTDNAKPTPNIKYTLVLCHSLRYARAHTHIRKRRTKIGTRGIILYPVGHLSLLSLKIPESCEVSKCQNRALINAFLICLLPSANDVRHPRRRFTVQNYNFFLNIPNYKYKKMPLISENINGGEMIGRKEHIFWIRSFGGYRTRQRRYRL